MESFKRMYNGEYLHRVMGHLSTAVFVGPLCYLYAKGKIPSHLHRPVALIVSIGVAQWFLGRSNVKKSIEEEHGRRHERPTGRVPPFGLTEHVCTFLPASIASLMRLCRQCLQWPNWGLFFGRR